MKKIASMALVAIIAGTLTAGTAYAESNSQGFGFGRSLVRGMSGDDVAELQALLAADPDVYPAGLVTGFYGAMTEKAVRQFQKKHGIEQVGAFGPKTKAKILGLFQGKALPPGIAKKLETRVGSTTPKHASTTASTTENATICHIPPGNSGKKNTLVVGAPAVKAHLAHGDTVGPCNGTPPPPPDTKAPGLVGINAANVASSTATINWTTDELADSTVWFGTTTPVSLLSPTLSVSSTTLVTSHSLGLSGLASSTIYYFAVQSKDAAGNTATSTSLSFTTLAI